MHHAGCVTRDGLGAWGGRARVAGSGAGSLLLTQTTPRALGVLTVSIRLQQLRPGGRILYSKRYTVCAACYDACAGPWRQRQAGRERHGNCSRDCIGDDLLTTITMPARFSPCAESRSRLRSPAAGP